MGDEEAEAEWAGVQLDIELDQRAASPEHQGSNGPKEDAAQMWSVAEKALALVPAPVKKGAEAADESLYEQRIAREQGTGSRSRHKHFTK
jgi:hypothetical protein